MTRPHTTGEELQPLLEIADLRVDLQADGGHTSILQGVNLHVGRGEAVGIAGESGSGKSMTAMAVMGLLPGSARLTGSIRLHGQELVGLAEKAYRTVRGRGVGMVFQDSASALHPMLTVGRQLTEHLGGKDGLSRADARDRAVDLLRLVRLPRPEQVVRGYPHQLSGGMRQRVAIAVALARDPDILIADEPTTALDVTVQAGLLRLLDQLRQEQGLSVLFITHDLGVLASLTERMYVFYAGQVMEEGRTAELMGRPRHPYTSALLHARPQGLRHRGALQAIPGAPALAGEAQAGCPFAPRCSFTLARCRTEVPPLADVSGERHRSACHVLPELDGAHDG